MFFRRKKAKESEAAQAPANVDADGTAQGPASTQFLTGDQSADRGTVGVLLDTIARVSESQDLESLLDHIVDQSVELTGAERGLLLMRGPDESLQVRVARSREPDKATGSKSLAGDLRFSTTIAGRVLNESEPVRATVHSESEALELGRSVYDLKLRAVMCVPLTRAPGDPRATRETSGVLYVDSRAATRQFSQRDLSLFAALAQHISIALENAVKRHMHQSLELAKAIQSDLMPSIPRDVPGYDLHGWYRPAEEAGGDFFDFVRTGSGGMAVVVGDATGHGIGPALITASAQAGLRSYLRLVSDPAQIVSLLNQDLCERVEDGRFITLFLGLLGDDGTIDSVNAGHEPPLVWRKATGEFHSLGRGVCALGMLEDAPYVASPSVRLESGDVFVAFTDGLIEIRDSKAPDVLWGLERLKARVAESTAAGRTSEEIALAVVNTALAFAKEFQEDDVTLVVVRRE